ncbi:MAG TPA: hypothetical protein PK156_45035 [Polyangium sp.]|nr:hypothetical protein [Polyangium sp.]
MNRDELVVDIKRLMIRDLDLLLQETDIKDDMLLFDENGLGLYSSLVPKFVAVVEARYNVPINLNDEEGRAAISSVQALADYLMKYGMTGT